MAIEKTRVLRKLEYEVFILNYCDDGILYIYASGDEITLLQYIALIPKIGEMTDGKKVPILCTPDEFLVLDEHTRKYMARADANPYSLASAFITRSLSQKLLGNFFMNFLKPARRIRMFTNREEAITWLKSILARDKSHTSLRASSTKTK